MSRLSKLREKYARDAVKTLLAEGLYVTVNNGVFNICNREKDISVLCDAMFSNVIDRLIVFQTADCRNEPKPWGWVELDYRGSHIGLFADYDANVAILLQELDARLCLEVIEDRRKTR